MKSQILVGMLLTVALAGCSSGPMNPTLLALQSWENAHYELALLTDERAAASWAEGGAPTAPLAPEPAEVIGAVDVSYVAQTQHVIATARVALETTKAGLVERPEPYEVRLTINAQTGQLVEASGPAYTEFPISSRRTQPNIANLVLTAFQADMLLEAVPIGPQWNLLAATTPQAWGDSSFEGERNGDGWYARTSAPCDLGCTINPPAQHILTSEYSGSGPGFLPSFVRHGAPTLPFVLQLTRTSGTISGEPQGVDPTPLDPTLVSPDAEDPCGWVPCDGADWPSSLSLQDGAGHLASWPPFALSGGRSTPYNTLVGSGTSHLLQQPLMDHRIWVMHLIIGDNVKAYIIEERDSNGPMPLATVTEGSSRPAADLGVVDQDWPIPMVPLDVAVLPLLLERGVDPLGLPGVSWGYGSPLQTPDIHYRSVALVPLEAEQPGQVAWISMTTGQMVRLSNA